MLGVDAYELKGEVVSSVRRVEQSLQNVTEKGSQRLLKHPAVKAFWGRYFSDLFKVSFINYEVFLPSVVIKIMSVRLATMNLLKEVVFI